MSVTGKTLPDQRTKLEEFRDEMIPRSVQWKQALRTWTCPTPAANSNMPCDPCGKGFMGNWDHMMCRGPSNGTGESSMGVYDGTVTNIHITDVSLNGPIPKGLCRLSHLRELDLDGGMLTGPLPDWIVPCFPQLAELDLTFNRLTGTLPLFITQFEHLREFEVAFNSFTGPIPPEYGTMDKLFSIKLDENRLTGTIPSSFRLLNRTLNLISISGNDFEGDLHNLAAAKLVIVKVHDNPKLCGMVPASVRYAKGYNPEGTRLGYPC